MIDRAAQMKHLAIFPDVDLIDVLPPMPMAMNPIYPLPADVRGEHRSEPVSPVPHRLVTKVDAKLEEQVLDVP